MKSVEFSELALRILWQATWQCAVLAAIVFIVIQSIGRWITPSWRVALWAIPLVRLVALLLPASGFSLFQWVGDPIAQIPQSFTAGKSSSQATWPTPADFEPTRSFSAERPLTIADNRNFVPQTATRPRERIVLFAMMIWISGIAVQSMRWLGSRIALHRVLRRGERLRDATLLAFVEEHCRRTRGVRRITCILTDEELGPSTCGLLRPTVLLSKRMIEEFSANELRMILAHELEHIRRLDCLLLGLGRLATTLHWLNPLAYVLRRQIHREMELAVDESTVAALGESKATTYGQLLIRLASRPSRQLGLIQMAGRGTNLRRRIDQLTMWRKPRRWQWVLGGLIVLLLACTGLSNSKLQSAIALEPAVPLQTTTNRADETTSKPTTESEQQLEETANESRGNAPAKKDDHYRASGRVVDKDGKPVPGARLFSKIYTDDGTLQTVSASSDERGEFLIVYPPGGREFESFHTWVYSRNHSIRVVMMRALFYEQESHLAENVEVQLPPKEETAFRVLQPDGEPCADAMVRPGYFDVPNGTFAADESTGLSNLFPEEWTVILGRRTDLDGRVLIESIPHELINSIVVESPRFGSQQFQRLEEKLQLAEVGSVNGVLVADEPGQFSGLKVYVETESFRPTRGTWSPQGLAEVVIDQNGRFEIPAIAPGELKLRLHWDSDLDVRPMLPEKHHVTAGQTANVMIDVRPTTLVTGQVVTSDTREPVVGATLSLHHRHALDIGSQTQTDAQGRYSIRLPAGSIRRHVISLGPTKVVSEYDHPRLAAIDVPAGVQSFEAEEIQISPMKLVKGVLKDAAAKPIGNTTVVLHTGTRRHLAGKADTNLDGTFEMRVRHVDTPDLIREKTWYWATLDHPAVGAQPPQLTRLTVLDDNPNAMVLRKP